MLWHVHVNAALAAGAKLLAEKREQLEVAGALAPLELLLQHLDVAAALAAQESSKRKDPPVSEALPDWDNPNYRYSPPDTV